METIAKQTKWLCDRRQTRTWDGREVCDPLKSNIVYLPWKLGIALATVSDAHRQVKETKHAPETLCGSTSAAQRELAITCPDSHRLSVQRVTALCQPFLNDGHPTRLKSSPCSRCGWLDESQQRQNGHRIR